MIEKILVKIRTERSRKGYSQDYMASRLKISQSSYNKLENGNTALTLGLFMEINLILDLDITETISLNPLLTVLKIDKNG